jgi:hypothetical protein
MDVLHDDQTYTSSNTFVLEPASVTFPQGADGHAEERIFTEGTSKRSDEDR